MCGVVGGMEGGREQKSTVGHEMAMAWLVGYTDYCAGAHSSQYTQQAM